MLSVLAVFKEKSKTSGITTNEITRDFTASNLHMVGSKISSLRDGFPITSGCRWETHQIIVFGDASGTCTQDSGMG